MRSSELTWDKIKELADIAVKNGKDFQLSTDISGYVSVDITTPTRTITKSEFEYVPVKEKINEQQN